MSSREAKEIEEMMRLMHRGILSDISRDRFRRDARQCYKEMQQVAMTSFDPDETN